MVAKPFGVMVFESACGELSAAECQRSAENGGKARSVRAGKLLASQIFVRILFGEQDLLLEALTQGREELMMRHKSAFFHVPEAYAAQKHGMRRHGLLFF